MEEYQLVRIVNVEDFGVFVKFDGETENRLCYQKNLKNEISKYHKNDYIWCKDGGQNQKGKLAIEYKHVEKHNMYNEFKKIFSKGDIIKGRVKNITDETGIFIEIYPEVDALLHKSKYDKTIKLETIKEKDIIEVMIDNIGEIETGFKKRIRINLAPVPKGMRLLSKIKDVGADDFLKFVGITAATYKAYKSIAKNDELDNEAIRELISISYKEATENNKILCDKTEYIFELKGKTKHGGRMAVTVQKNRLCLSDKKWYVSRIGSSSKLVANAINLFAYIDNWSYWLKELDKMLLPGENWEYPSVFNSKNLESPDEDEKEYFILKQYLNYTFYCAELQGLISFSDKKDFAAFNTGLVNSSYDYIYMCFSASELNGKKVWHCEGFTQLGTESLGKIMHRQIAQEKIPPRVDFLKINSKSDEDILGDIIFDTSRAESLKNGWDQNHILIDNISRLPLALIKHCCREEDFSIIKDNIKNIEENNDVKSNYAKIQKHVEENAAFRNHLKEKIDKAIKIAIKKCEWNYKTAIPIFYHVTNSIDLLLPLCLSDDEQIDNVDTALVVSRELPSGNYQGQTILTLPMAYLDARLICRPNSEWLTPEKINDK